MQRTTIVLDDKHVKWIEEKRAKSPDGFSLSAFVRWHIDKQMEDESK